MSSGLKELLPFVNTHGACVCGPSLAVPASECNPDLNQGCVFMSFLNPISEKKKKSENLLFFNVSFLHPGYEFKFCYILHSLSCSHSC